MAGPATSLFTAVPLAATFDLSCSAQSGRCIGVVEGANQVRTATFPNVTQSPALMGAGPVAALMSNDQALIAFRRGTNIEVVNLADPALPIDSVPMATLEVRNLVLADSPVVLAAVDYATVPPTVRLGALGERGFSLSLDASWNPDVSMGHGGQGLVVVTQDDVAAASTTVSLQRFQVPLDTAPDAGRDAGLADAGSPDAGPADAGPLDGGAAVDGGVADGGAAEPLAAAGCTCDALSGAWATWLVLAWAVRRRLIS
jgi:hypothetical protein